MAPEPTAPPAAAYPPADTALLWKVDECSVYFDRLHLRGWCFVQGAEIASVAALFPGRSEPAPLRSYGLPSPDVATAVDPHAVRCRFDDWVPLPPAGDFVLRAELASGAVLHTSSIYANARFGDPSYVCWDHFFDALQTFDSGEVLELGARARSGVTRRHLVPAKLRYVGFDILAGPNVDIVGDAHELSAVVGRQRFVAAMSFSVFEHLAMPWKVALELNRALVPGGLVFVNTLQTWPVHEAPWDFWRYTVYAWPTLFNAATGFEIVEAAQGEPARIHPLWDAPAVREMPEHPAYLVSNVIARKIAETTLDWPVPTAVAVTGSYPPGETPRPPR